MFSCLTGEGPLSLEMYMDMSDESEAVLIDSCFRDLRAHMG